MNVRETLKRSETVVGAVRDLRKLLAFLTRGHGRGRRIRNYLATNPVRKLQLGAGTTALPGWLCTDVTRVAAHVVYLDATRTFPFEDGAFDYVYSEHMLEHVSWHEGLFVLKECRRVLKPGGTIRIATPDLAVILGLYGGDGHDEGQEYIKWITDLYVPGVNAYKASFVVNNAFRNWGHQFLYDGDLLVSALQQAGFTNLRRCAPGESSDQNLRGIERHGTNVRADDMNRFETMVYEGDKPL